jgi:hypothetical protein
MRGALRLRYFALASATIALLSAQDFSGLKLELTAKDFQYTQGPAWSAVGSFLILAIFRPIV